MGQADKGNRPPSFEGGRPVDASRKPSSVPPEGHPAGGSDHSSRAAVTGRLEQPTRRLGRVTLPRPFGRGALRPCLPTRPCSRWGLPCRPRCRGRGGLLPRRFTLTARGLPCGARGRRSFLCGTLLGVSATGRYPASHSMELGLSSRPRDPKASRAGDRLFDIDGAKLHQREATRDAGSAVCRKSTRQPSPSAARIQRDRSAPENGFGRKATGRGPSNVRAESATS
jgi:hypothetical protein